MLCRGCWREGARGAWGKTKRKEGKAEGRVGSEEEREVVGEVEKFWAVSPQPCRKMRVWVCGEVEGVVRLGMVGMVGMVVGDMVWNGRLVVRF